MYFMALATDYDGTIAHDGIVGEATVEALEKLKESGRRLILVTGRELPDLERVCPRVDLFDRVVAENGALLYAPDTKASRPLAPEPPQAFVDRLRSLDVQPLSVGQVIVATWEPNETKVLGAIRDLGLDLQIIFNKGAVMVLPNGVNKASGLHAALSDLGLSAHNVMAVGDAENDLAFMRMCGCAVAVSNALDAVKDAADWTTRRARGEGVAELADLARSAEESLLAAAIGRHTIELGTADGGEVVHLEPGAGNVLITGASGGGKSTVATGLIERLAENAFQFCVFDPEGDYAELDSAVTFGDAKTVARTESILDALKDPDTNVVANMLGLGVADRPDLFAKLYPAVLNYRGLTGRPHWILVDEAHHMLPKHRATGTPHIASAEPPTIFVTVHPETLAEGVLDSVGAVVSIGATADIAVRAMAEATGRVCPAFPPRNPERGEALFWNARGGGPVRMIKITPPKQAMKRHTRKYAEGALGEDKSFYFTGPEGALNLRAQNLMIFLQLADGVDEATFMHHLAAGDFSRWFRAAIKDDALAEAAEGIETQRGVTPADARSRLREAVESRYTAPAEGVS